MNVVAKSKENEEVVETPSVSDQIMDGIDSIQDATDDEGEAEQPVVEPEEKEVEEVPSEEGEVPEEKEPEEEKEEKEEEKEEEKAEAYDVPDGLSERAAERFQTMVSDLKQKDQLLANQNEILTGFQEMIRDTGMDGAELSQVMSLAKVVKENPQEGIARLVEYAKNLAREAGIKPEFGEYDPLSDFPDLREKVEDLEVSEELALEIARTRRRDQQETQKKAEDERTSRSDMEFEEARNDGLASVGQFLQKAEKDIDFQKISPYLNEAAIYAAENLPPKQWLGYIQEEYRRIGKIMKDSRQTSGRRTTPLADGVTPGGGKVPQTIEDVVNSILD